jgi:hypothetical protein
MDNDTLFALKLYYEDEYDDEYNIIKMLKIELINQNMPENEINTKLKEFYDSFGSNIDLEVFKNIKIRTINQLIINSTLNENATEENATEENANKEDVNEEDVNEEDATEEDVNEEDATEEDATEEDATEEDVPEENNENINISTNLLNNNIINSIFMFNMLTDQTEDIISTLNMLTYHAENNMLTDQTEDVISTLNEEDKNKLKKYILKNNVDDKCLICFDNLEIGQEIIELPCIHIYHSNCINEYLTKYNYKCPCCKDEVGRPIHNI